MMASDVMLLPLPDSPTRPRISPRSMENEMPETISTGLADGPMETVRSRTASISALPAEHFAKPRVETVAQSITNQVQRKRGQHDHHAGKEQQPRCAGDEGSRFRKHVAPARYLGRRAKAKKIERCRTKLGERKYEARLH